MTFEEILSLIGGFGRFQKILYVWICLPQIFLAFHMLISIFTGATPPHVCRSAPPPGDRLGPDLNTSLLSAREEQLACPHLLNGSAGICPGGWDYNTDVFHSTVVTEVILIGLTWPGLHCDWFR